jgi:hypothetical protein
MADCAPGEPSPQLLDAVRKAFSLLNRSKGKLWRDLQLEARRLIEQSRD